MQNGNLDVAVIGGGVVGLCCAFDLCRRGAEVALFERGSCGSGASLRNGGWVTPALSTPMPEPGAAPRALMAMMRPDSPFLLRPRFDLSLLNWGWQFWRSSSKSRWRRGVRQLLRLNRHTNELFDQLRADGVTFEMHTSGLMFVCLSAGGLRGIHELFSALGELGYPGVVEELSTEDALEREPALSASLAGGIFARDERHVRPETLVTGLVAALRDRGVQVNEDTAVRRIRTKEGGWTLDTPSGALGAKRLIIAAGSSTHHLLRPLGIRIPLEGAKGYSMTAQGEGNAPKHSLYLTEAKVGFTPFDDGGRLSGTLELGAADTRIKRRRLDSITGASARYLREWRPGRSPIEWAGVRPLAPDGLPLIGAMPGRDGLYLAGGHGMFGVTLAPATASALTSLVLDNQLLPVLAPFRPDRLARRQR